MRATILHPSIATAAIIHLTEPLSLWGGFDQNTGLVIDRHHPQCGQSLTDKIMVMHHGKGSGTAPGALAEALRLGLGPAGIILVLPDVNLAIGAAVAEMLYGSQCPVLCVGPEQFAGLIRVSTVSITREGEIIAQDL
jgi:uncharacterized protein